MNANTNTARNIVNVSDLASLLAQKAELKALERQLKEAQALREWEDRTSARNPSYVRGSVRKATEADAEVLGHTHGEVCEIKCQSCGTVRAINKQDAFQVRFCLGCRKESQKLVAKERRAQESVKKLSKDDLEAKIAQLAAQLAAIG